MKFRIMLKDPDGFSDGVDEGVAESIRAMTEIADDEKDAIKEKRAEKVWAALDKFVEYKEYVEIEFDTDAGTAVVVARK